ncbi:ABC transporter permease, partial [Klebsiella pneumoniae]|nr:ABC transporter permease [Klebsiella pneumoniae]
GGFSGATAGGLPLERTPTGIDLPSGSVIALAAMGAASLAQTSDSLSPMFPALVNLPAGIPICAGIRHGLPCGPTNRFPGARAGMPPLF